jgi:protease-4
MRRIGRFFLWVFTAIGILTAASFVSVGIWFALVDDDAPELPERMILSLDLNKGVTEKKSGSPFGFLSRGAGPVSIREFLMALEKAETDERVAGLAVRLGATGVSLAQAQELRDAVAKFRKSGKSAIAYATSFASSRGATVEYYLATAFDTVWMQPSGELAITGISLEIPFAAEALEKVGVKAKLRQRQEFKSAPETFMRRSLSKPARQNLQSLVDTWLAQIVDGIAKGRNIPVAAARRAIDTSPLLAQEARARGLIDTLGYWPAFVAATQEKAGGKKNLVNLRPYIAEGDLPNSEGPTVALIHGVGPIVSDKPKSSPFDDRSYLAADDMEAAIVKAVNDKNIKAILLRLDSPGGSYVASDTVWHAVIRARELGKPVIVSMGSTAASGGYFIAMAADVIVAQPGTLTGSIGVYGGKFVTEALWEKLGVNWQDVHAGKNATMWSPFQDYPEGAEARLDAQMDFIYRDFTGKVAERRKFDEKQIDAVARGRIWTGARALNAGLVDRLGGLTEAVAATKEALSLAPDASVLLQEFPRRKLPLERLLEFVAGETENMSVAVVDMLGIGGLFSDALKDRLEPFVGDLDLLQPPVGRLQLPPVRLRY